MNTERVDFSGAWDSLWMHLSAGMSPAMTDLMTWAGAGLVVWSAIRWLWSRHRGTLKKASDFLWTLTIGVILLAPGAIIPIFMNLLDALVNTVLNLGNR